MEINVPKAINGPKGKGSFLPLILNKSRTTAIIPPITAPNISPKGPNGQPRKRPVTATSLMSPPPIPPLLAKAISSKKPEVTSRPARAETNPTSWAAIFNITPPTRPMMINELGMMKYSKSIKDIATRRALRKRYLRSSKVKPK